MNLIKEGIIKCLKHEAQNILNVADNLNEETFEFVHTINQCEGKLFFTGVGKSFIIATKMAGTFSSLGISSIPIEPLSMLHGNLGALDKKDFLIAISNSGETDILLKAVEESHKMGNTILSITGNKNSSLAQYSKKTIEILTEEADPFGIVPTSSTTTFIAMGDAIVCALCHLRNITINDFKKYHPAGTLGE